MTPYDLKPEMQRPTPAAQKALALIFMLFFVLFVKYKPYEHVNTVAHSFSEQLFVLYFFICNQTLGMIHEAGHGICYLLNAPEFVMVLSGTLLQLLFPLGVACYYRRKGEPFGYLAGLFFLGFSLQYTAWYMSTSHQGPYISAANSFLGVDAYHDFHYMFSRTGLLEHYNTLASLTRFAAYIVMLYALVRMVAVAFFITPFQRPKKPLAPKRSKADNR